MTLSRTLGAAALPLVLVLAACSGGGGSTQSPASSAAPVASSAASPSDGASPTGSDSASEDYPLKVAAGSGAVTNYLTGKDGLTLYIFQKDTKDSGKSVCNDKCLANWPAYAADEVDEVEADAAVTGKLSIVTRDDGTKQLAYNGMPLYYFAGDKAAGDTNGAAIANWAVAKP